MKLQTLLLATAFLFLLTSDGLSQAKRSVESEISSSSNPSPLVKKSYHLKGFKQSCCASIVKYSLQEVKGFHKVESNVKMQEITVWYDKEKCTEREIKKAINKTPYKIIEENPDEGDMF